MTAYLRNRLRERSTWVGLAVALACIALAWIYREQIYTALVGIAALVRAGLPDRLINSRISAALAPIQPATVRSLRTVELPAQPPRSLPMSSSLVATLEAAALDGLKVAATALPAPTGPAISAVLNAFENQSTANVLAAVVAVVGAVEVALATVPPGFVAAPDPQQAAQAA